MLAITSNLEIGLDRKKELLDEDLFEWGDVILLIKYQHGFLIIYGINSSEWNRTVTMGYQYAVAYNARSPFISIRECLNIR